MGFLINDLLDFSRSLRVAISIRTIDMNLLFSETAKIHLVGGYGQKIMMKKDDLPAAHGDETLITRVVSNLLGNAIKFTRDQENPLIEIGAKRGTKENVYFVRDNGKGFDMRYYDKLFDVFQRLHTEEEAEGTGIGLAIVKRIIERHGGRVWAESKVGEGATFYFSLPADKA